MFGNWYLIKLKYILATFLTGPKLDKVVTMGIMHLSIDSNNANKNIFHFKVGANKKNP